MDNSRIGTKMSLRDIGSNPSKYGYNHVGEVLNDIFDSYRMLHPLKMGVQALAVLIELFGEMIAGVLLIAAWVTLVNWLVDKASDAYQWLKGKVVTLLALSNPATAGAMTAIEAASAVGKAVQGKDADELFDDTIAPKFAAGVVKAGIASAMPLGMGAALFSGDSPAPVPGTRSSGHPAEQQQTNLGRQVNSRRGQEVLTARVLQAVKDGGSIAKEIQKTIRDLSSGQVLSDIDPNALLASSRGSSGYEINPIDLAFVQGK